MWDSVKCLSHIIKATRYKITIFNTIKTFLNKDCKSLDRTWISPKSILTASEQVVTLKIIDYLAVDQNLKYFWYSRYYTNWSIIIVRRFATFFINRNNLDHFKALRVSLIVKTIIVYMGQRFTDIWCSNFQKFRVNVEYVKTRAVAELENSSICFLNCNVVKHKFIPSLTDFLNKFHSIMTSRNIWDNIFNFIDKKIIKFFCI